MLGSIQRQVMTVVDEVEREEGEKEDENMKLEGRGRGGRFGCNREGTREHLRP